MAAPHSSKKHPHTSKKRRAIERQKAAKTQNNTHISEVQKTPTVVKTTELTPAPPAKHVKEIVYPYLGLELKRIGILAAVILVILVILSIVLT